MRTVLRAACIAAAIISPAAADNVVCGQKWISFEPLFPEALSSKPGLNSYMIRKTDILRTSSPKVGPAAAFGYVIIVPLKGEARTKGEYRVTKKDYLEIRACLLDRPQ